MKIKFKKTFFLRCVNYSKNLGSVYCYLMDKLLITSMYKMKKPTLTKLLKKKIYKMFFNIMNVTRHKNVDDKRNYCLENDLYEC